MFVRNREVRTHGRNVMLARRIPTHTRVNDLYMLNRLVHNSGKKLAEAVARKNR